uniref:Titin n=1 Tax=Anser brachyrhynchus TaxID=132585 RepID=A0A8B9BGM5_9AVES
ELDVKLIEGLVVKAGTTVRLPAIMRGVPVPTAKWVTDGTEIKTDGRHKIETDNYSTVLTIKDCVRKDTGEYLLTVSNSAGSKTVALHLTVLDVPGPPTGPINILEVTPEHMVISWRPPKDDGGSPIINYIVEKRQSKKETWGGEPRELAETVLAKDILSPPEVNLDVTCRDLITVRVGQTIRITGKVKGRPDPEITWSKDGKVLVQEKRVEIVHDLPNVELQVKEAKRSDHGKYIIAAKNSCGHAQAFAIVNISNVSAEKATLTWSPPAEDGGSPIKSYVLEKRETSRLLWTLVAENIESCRHVVSKLIQGNEYVFRVSAVNQYGKGEPVQSEPKTVIAKAGDNIKIEIPVLGRPRPTVTWKKEDQMLKQTQRVNYENTATATILTINECTRSDSGQYPLSAKNIVGEVSEVITVQVHDIPGPPTGPIKFDEISSDFVTFSWQPPLNDGGVPISNYVVEMRQTDSTTWTELATTVIRTIFKATRLTTGVEYQFRVKAQNRYGIGPAITSESVVANYPFKVPGPPGTPQVTAVTKETMTISWNEPVTDGGSPILGYHVERKERNSILWQTVSKMLVSGNIFKSTGLTDGIAYEFRVIAENLAGKSKPSKPSEPVFALDPIDPPGKPIPLNITRHAVTLKWTKPEYNGACDTVFKPGPPGNPRVLDSSRSSITIAWNKPIYDGGSEITGYMVEIALPEEDEWKIVTPPVGLKATSFTITDLKENQEYK